MILPYKIDEYKKSIYIENDYIYYLTNIQKEIINNKLSVLNYSSYIDIATNFDLPNNPIEEIAYNSPRLTLTSVYKFQKQNFNNLPKKLKILNLCSVNIDCYKLDNLPTGLKKLYLPKSYCYELDNLPLEIEDLILYIDNNYVQLLSCLPESLKKLMIIAQKYDNINKVNINCYNLPNGLEKLLLDGNIDCELNNLPRNLNTLYLPQKYKNMIHNLPNKLEVLSIPIDYKYLRDIFSSINTVKLKKLIIGPKYKNHLHTTSSFDLKSIPASIEEIEFGNNFNQSLTYLPSGLKKITFGFNFNYSIGDNLPNSIEYLEFGNNFNQSLTYLPSGLKKITFGFNFNYSIGDNLPNSIEYLEFGFNFNNTITKYPSNLKILKFGRNYSLETNNLPNGLIELEINERFNNKLSNLPPTLEILKFNELSEYSNIDKLELPDSIRILQVGKNQKICCIKNIPKSLEYIKYNKLNIKITKLIEETC